MQFTVILDDAFRAPITGIMLEANAAMPQTVPDPSGATEEVRVGGTDEEPQMETRPVMVPNPALYASPEAYMIARNGDLARNYKQLWEARNPAPVPTDPTPPITGQVLEVTRRQARQALLIAGKLSLVQPAIDALPEPQRTLMQIEWDDSTTFQRTRPSLVAMATAIGLDDAGLDALFVAASKL